MPVRYKYNDADELIADRSWETHMSLNAARNEVLFGQILRNVMRHSFECGVTSQTGVEPEDNYE